ncbi:MAG TPA: hypothetical protein VEA16_14810 [Vicinamibacterales bacterium]|nr:hypothetical protein [Vicinamibacterales bacterium]
MRVALSASVATLFAATAVAAPLMSDAGLANPGHVVTFDEHILATGAIVTNQYQDHGVSFSPNLVYGLPDNTTKPSVIQGGLLRNFWPGPPPYPPFPGPVVSDPFSISFAATQTRASVGLFPVGGPTTLTALLNGNPVESFTVNNPVIPFTSAISNYGFTGIAFNEIRIDAANLDGQSVGTVLLDSIMFGTGLHGFKSGAGLVSPTRTVTFSEASLATGVIVTDQYLAQGIIVSPNLVQGLPNDIGEVFEGDLLRNFWPGPGPYPPFPGDIVNDPFSFKFDQPVDAAAVGLFPLDGDTILTAFLNGKPVESLRVTNSPFSDTIAYYGFDGILFDELWINPANSADGGTVLVDNLQFRIAQVPEPARIAVASAGLMLLAMRRRRALVRVG